MMLRKFFYMSKNFLTEELEHNPYLSEVLSLAGGKIELLIGDWEFMEESARVIRSRRELIYKYAYAIPSNNALQKIAAYSPIVEIGAGNGYWASLLSKMGVDIVAYDNWRNPDRKQWFDVQLADENVVKEHRDRTLLLCWPPHDNEMAANTLRQYEGRTVIYVGEDQGGCTATDSFFNFLYEHFTEEESVEIPTWPNNHDRMVIFKK